MIQFSPIHPILAAEPASGDAERLVRCLAPMAKYVQLARTGEEALALYRRHAFSHAVVAAELDLPDGPVLARLSQLPAIERLVATGPAGDRAAEIRARSSGAHAYLARPVSFDALARALNVPFGGPAEPSSVDTDPATEGEAPEPR